MPVVVRAVLVCLQLGVMLGASVAFADPPWHAPAGCPSAAELRSRIEKRLEHSLDAGAAGVEIDITRKGHRYQARVDLASLTVASDVRTLTSTRCSELADAVAVIVARAAGENLARHPATPAVPAHQAPTRAAVALAGDLADAPEPPVVVVDSIEPSSAPGDARPWTLGARLSGINGIGILPEVGVGAELAVTLRYGRHLAELGGATWFASAAQLHSGSPRALDVGLQTAVARFGWRPYETPLRGWAAVEVGNMRGGDVTAVTGEPDGGRWIAAGGGFGIAWQMTPWIRLLGTTEVLLAVERVRFTGSDGVVTYAPSPMSVRTTCGLEVGWQ
jgi:hypothetical protein